MKLIHVIWCVIFSVIWCQHAVLPTRLITKNITIGIIQRKDFRSPWTDKETLQTAIKQLDHVNTTNQSINFVFDYNIASNLSNVNECFQLLCDTLAPRNLQALLTTFDNQDSQMLTQWAGLAGIDVIGTSRSISLQNKVRNKL